MSDIIQGSAEWHELRRGKITASRVVDILPGVKGNYLAGRKNYLAEKVCEILTGEVADSFTNEAMQHGTDTEPLARSAYEAKTGNLVDEVGFVLYPEYKHFGASPDGLVNQDGCIEIKCPNTATHIDTLLNGNVKRQYKIQMQCVMMCCQRIWCDFISFDDRMPEKNQLYIKRFEFDNKLAAQIRAEIELFSVELNSMLQKLKEL